MLAEQDLTHDRREEVGRKLFGFTAKLFNPKNPKYLARVMVCSGHAGFYLGLPAISYSRPA